MSVTGYRGDVTAEEAWHELSALPDSVLIDVRTQAEWTFVGVPELDGIAKEPVFVEWQGFPDGNVTTDFSARLEKELEARGVSKEAPLFFICRSGARSRSAAIAMTSAGRTNCYNIGPGFEGPLDGDRHRNAQSGWRAVGLPWSQT